jgi:hypothetical protein
MGPAEHEAAFIRRLVESGQVRQDRAEEILEQLRSSVAR